MGQQASREGDVGEGFFAAGPPGARNSFFAIPRARALYPRAFAPPPPPPPPPAPSARFAAFAHSAPPSRLLVFPHHRPPLPSRSRVRDGAARADGRPAERRAAAGGGGGGADGSPVVDGRRRRLRHRQLQRVGRADPAAAERAGPRRVFEPAAGDVPVQVHRGQRVALRGGAADGARRDGQHQQLPDRHRPEHLSQRKPGVGLFRAPRNSPHFAAHFGAAI